MVYILFYIYNIYDLSSMNDVQVMDTGGNRCDREREREREKGRVYTRENVHYIRLYTFFFIGWTFYQINGTCKPWTWSCSLNFAKFELAGLGVVFSFPASYGSYWGPESSVPALVLCVAFSCGPQWASLWGTFAQPQVSSLLFLCLTLWEHTLRRKEFGILFGYLGQVLPYLYCTHCCNEMW